MLAELSAAAAWEIRPNRTTSEFVVRPGASSPRTSGALRVRYSQTLRGEVVRHPAHGFFITTPERTLVDLSPTLTDAARGKVVREALRARRTTIEDLRSALERHRGRRGTGALRALVERYARLQLDRCRSDAEAFAMEVLGGAGLLLPRVDHLVAGEEADLSWPALRLVIEIDGPQWHRLRDLDARKRAVWTRAGWTVERIPSDLVFAQPQTLVALARRHGVPRAGRG